MLFITIGKTTIIPIKVEGRDDVKENDLIQFNSFVHPQNAKSCTESKACNLNGYEKPEVLSPGCSTRTSFTDPIDDAIRRDHETSSSSRCRSSGCNFFGTPATGFFCSKHQNSKLPVQQQYRKLQTEI